MDGETLLRVFWILYLLFLLLIVNTTMECFKECAKKKHTDSYELRILIYSRTWKYLLIELLLMFAIFVQYYNNKMEAMVVDDDKYEYTTNN